MPFFDIWFQQQMLFDVLKLMPLIFLWKSAFMLIHKLLHYLQQIPKFASSFSSTRVHLIRPREEHKLLNVFLSFFYVLRFWETEKNRIYVTTRASTEWLWVHINTVFWIMIITSHSRACCNVSLCHYYLLYLPNGRFVHTTFLFFFDFSFLLPTKLVCLYVCAWKLNNTRKNIFQFFPFRFSV